MLDEKWMALLLLKFSNAIVAKMLEKNVEYVKAMRESPLIQSLLADPDVLMMRLESDASARLASDSPPFDIKTLKESYDKIPS